MTSQKWRISPPVGDVLPLSKQFGVPPLVLQLLHNRGISDPSQIEAFLAADERLHHDPFLLPDMEKGVARVLRALLGHETIAVYGDFDADGITSTVVMVEGLRQMGAKVIPYIPHRVDEGHGLNNGALEQLRQQGATLVITVDCGVSGVPEVQHATAMGLDIVITDHHPPPYQLPQAVAVIDPKRPDSAYPFPELAGVGVAFKFIEGLFQTTGKTDGRDMFLDLVALGTVADLAPLLGENRYLVKRGVEALNHTHRPGLIEMMRCAGLEMGKITTESIAFSLGPRLNASGRMEHAVIGYDLLTAATFDAAHEVAVTLEELNAERQKLTAETVASVKEKLEDPKLPVLITGDSGYVPGVLGIVANKLVDEFYRPSIVFQIDGDVIRGSGRSIPEFDLFRALGEIKDLFTRYGGHKMAAGFTMPTENLEQFRSRLIEIASEQLDVSALQPTLDIDAEVPLAGVGGLTYKALNMLAPFGKANHVPTLLSRKVKVINYRGVGNNGKHLKLKLRQGPVVWDGIVFNHNGQNESAALTGTPNPFPHAQAGTLNRLSEDNLCLDIVYHLEVETWNGSDTLRLNIVDFATS